MTSPDKASNMYQLTKGQHDLLKTNNNIKKQINMGGKNLMTGKQVIKQMETNEDGNNFITIKYHKENFDNQPTVRLTNTAKN